MLECIVDFLCLAVPPALGQWEVNTPGMSAQLFYYIYMSKKILAQQSDWVRGASHQGYVHSIQSSWQRSCQTEDTLYLLVNTPNIESTIKMCHHIAYYSNTPGPEGSLTHKETDHFVQDTVTRWNNSVKSACREMAGYEFRKTNRFRGVFFNSIQSVKEWLCCSDPKRWYFCRRDIYI